MAICTQYERKISAGANAELLLIGVAEDYKKGSWMSGIKRC